MTGNAAELVQADHAAGAGGRAPGEPSVTAQRRRSPGGSGRLRPSQVPGLEVPADAAGRGPAPAWPVLLRPSGALADRNAAWLRPSLAVLRAPGQPLAAGLRTEMETRFGADFSDVRVHTGATARASAARFGARAYTSGSHVVIGDGGTDKVTLAHELSHVIQQRQGPVDGTEHGGVTFSDPSGAHEQAAEATARRVMSGSGRRQPAWSPAVAGSSPGAPAPARGDQGQPGVSRRLFIGGKEQSRPDVGKQQLKPAEKQRLGDEVTSGTTSFYDTWEDARLGLRSVGIPIGKESPSLRQGDIVITNPGPATRELAGQLLDVLARSPLIIAYLNSRPCHITFSYGLGGGNPAEVIDLNSEVDVTIAVWYVMKYGIGYTVGLLSHEFGIHPIPSSDTNITDIEKTLLGNDLPTQIDVPPDSPYTVNTSRAVQPDHIFGSMPGLSGRHEVYMSVVIDMAKRLFEDTKKPNTKITEQRVTELFDAFLMDVSTILATNDHRERGVLTPSLVKRFYNLRLIILGDAINEQTSLPQDPAPRDLLRLLPARKKSGDIIAAYNKAALNLLPGGTAGGTSNAYQPTSAQNKYLEKNKLQLSWVEPDNLRVFGALGRFQQMTAAAARQSVMQALILANLYGTFQLAPVLALFKLTLHDVIGYIQDDDWSNPEAGIAVLNVAAKVFRLGLRVVLPDGKIISINGGGNDVLVQVTQPLEHYHVALPQ